MTNPTIEDTDMEMYHKRSCHSTQSRLYPCDCGLEEKLKAREHKLVLQGKIEEHKYLSDLYVGCAHEGEYEAIANSRLETLQRELGDSNGL